MQHEVPGLVVHRARHRHADRRDFAVVGPQPRHMLVDQRGLTGAARSGETECAVAVHPGHSGAEQGGRRGLHRERDIVRPFQAGTAPMVSVVSKLSSRSVLIARRNSGRTASRSMTVHQSDRAACSDVGSGSRLLRDVSSSSPRRIGQSDRPISRANAFWSIRPSLVRANCCTAANSGQLVSSRRWSVDTRSNRAFASIPERPMPSAISLVSNAFSMIQGQNRVEQLRPELRPHRVRLVGHAHSLPDSAARRVPSYGIRGSGLQLSEPCT